MSTTELQAAVRKTLTSKAFERFIGLAVENAMLEAARIECAVQLLAHQDKRVEFDDRHSALYVHTASKCYAITVYRGRPNSSDTHPDKDGVWRGTEDRFDATGRKWQRSIRDLVCNDFGDLVEVLA